MRASLHCQLKGSSDTSCQLSRTKNIDCPRPATSSLRAEAGGPLTSKNVAKLIEKHNKRQRIVKKHQNSPWPAQKAVQAKLRDSALLLYERRGHLLTRSVFDPEHVEELAKEVWKNVEARKLEALKHRVRVLCPGSKSTDISTTQEAHQKLLEIGTEPVGFLQTFNIWRQSKIVWQSVNQLAGIASQLLGCRSVRLYQDCAFLKEPGFSITNWHSDLRMAPLDTNDFITAWIPLRAIKEKDDSGLIFASGSHRDFALPFWHQSAMESMDLAKRGYKLCPTGPMDLGDISWHHGWTLHTADAQPRSSPPRLALSISYFREGARVLPKQAAKHMQLEDQESFAGWRKEVKDGALASHRLLPLLSFDLTAVN